MGRSLERAAAMFAFLLAVTLGYGPLGCERELRRGGPHHYAWAELNASPARPTRPIGEDEARKLAASGHAYYRAYFDDSGRLMVLEHWTRAGVDYSLRYTYSGGKVLESRTGRR